MVRINKIAEEEGITCELLAKCEYFNAGGSVKDRIGFRMVEDAELAGRIKPGDTLIEPTSGNTGIGLALAAALKGYKMIITLPEKMSNEKVDILKGLGAEIIRTPTEAAFDSPESHIGVAKRLNQEIPNSHILDQYGNPSNPIAHYDGTAEEILEQTEGKIDAIVLTAGTGGTVTGIARKLKERVPTVKIIAVDPLGSILAEPESLNSSLGTYKVEGIGYDFIPNVLERSLVDEWLKSEDKDSFLMSRRLIKSEGLLVGGSSGSAMHAGVQVAKRYGPGARVVVLLADSVRNYMSKFLNDNWMSEGGFADEIESSLQKEWWGHKTVADLHLRVPYTIGPSVTCLEAVSILEKNGYDQLPVVDDAGNVLGVVSTGNLQSKIIVNRVLPTDPVSKAIYKQFKQVEVGTSLAKLSVLFNTDHFALVVATQRVFLEANKPTEKKLVVGVATSIDLLNFITTNQPKAN
jgi:cystathionine beta-synthase